MSSSRPIVRGAAKPLRCAIYTRKSTESGLEQAFNSLDNQREAAEAYIKSQAHEGWRLAPGAYDDGGYSGGSLDRPALQQLLAEVRAGKVDIIVVYKVDRLTRSLSDFAKLVELFDTHGVSFVSVTQAFNTTTSMGRLTLNVLLSFAQFEREVTGERIRDKIASSKKKGLRVGGPVPLGYELKDKKLVPCPIEAEQVRLIFRLYSETGSLGALLTELDRRGLVTKACLRPDGTRRGGVRFNKSGLSYLLRNRCYIGEVIHKHRYYPGQHEPIVERALFDTVNTALDARSSGERSPSANHDSLLKGLLYDAHGHRMTPTSSLSRGPLYRYYISRAVAENRRAEAPGRFRVSAPQIETCVLKAVGLGNPIEPGPTTDGAAGVATSAHALRDELRVHIERITLRAADIEIVWMPSPDGERRSPLIVPLSQKRSTARTGLISPVGQPDATPLRSAMRARLVQGIANARLWLEELAEGRAADTTAIAEREGVSERHVRMVLNLAFLPPPVVQAAISGTLSGDCGLVRLSELPMLWPLDGAPASDGAACRNAEGTKSAAAAASSRLVRRSERVSVTAPGAHGGQAR
jgi:DNA invertase Pin-like site-specific DNA recombinase